MRHPRLDPFCEGQSAAFVAAEHRARQAEIGCIGEFERVLFVPRALDRGDGAEDLVGDEAIVLAHIGEDMRRDDQPVGLAAQRAGRALILGLGDHVRDLVELVAIDDRPDHAGRIVALANHQILRASDEFLYEFVVDRILDHQAIGDHADLALMDELAPDAGFDRIVDIGIVQHHDRRIAAKLQFERFEPLGIERGLADTATHRCRPGEGHHRGDRMLDHGIADLRARTGQHRDEAGRKLRLFADRGKQGSAGDDRIACRFDDDAIAQRERGKKRAGGQLQWEIPRRDQCDHTGRLAIGAAFLAGQTFRQDRPFDHEGESGGLLPGDLRHQHQFERGLQPGAADLSHDPVRDLVLTRVENIGDRVHLGRASGGRELGPFLLRFGSGAIGFVDIVGGRTLHLEDRAFVPRADIRQRFAAAVAPFARQIQAIEFVVFRHNRPYSAASRR